MQAALAPEQKLLRDKARLLEQQTMLTQEFEHRLVNGLQLVTSLLSMQSRATANVEAAAQLMVASVRVAAIGRVHRRLHLLDHEDSVAINRYVTALCEDLTGLFFHEQVSLAPGAGGKGTSVMVVFASETLAVG